MHLSLVYRAWMKRLHFKNYYPLRKAADKLVREQFVALGGKPQFENFEDFDRFMESDKPFKL